MKKLILLIHIFLLPALIFAQYNEEYTLSNEQEKRVIEVAGIWIEEIFKAEDVDKVMQVSDIPFTIDDEKIVNSKAELRMLYLGVFEEKGKRSIPKFEKEILEHVCKIESTCNPLNFANVRVFVREGEHKGEAIVCVAIKDDEYKVVGFSD